MVKKDHVVAIHYKLTDKTGKELDKSEGEPLKYLHGHKNIIGGLEKGLEGHKTGDKFTVHVPAAEAYGLRNDDMCFEIDRKELGDGTPKVGMMARLSTDDGMVLARIIKVDDEKVTFDANHPLAGEDLTFDIEIGEIRPATAEEIKQGCPAEMMHDCGGDCHECGGCH